MPGTVKLHRVFKSTPEKVYKAFVDPDAKCKWLPPHGFFAKSQSSDVRVGGGYKMSFTNFTTGHVESFGGEYLELVPGKRIRYTDKFDNPALPGAMNVTVDIKKVSVGVELTILHEGIPDAIPADGCYIGWGESLELLKLLVEPVIPNE